MFDLPVLSDRDVGSERLKNIFASGRRVNKIYYHGVPSGLELLLLGIGCVTTEW